MKRLYSWPLVSKMAYLIWLRSVYPLMRSSSSSSSTVSLFLAISFWSTAPSRQRGCRDLEKVFLLLVDEADAVYLAKKEL